ncbi:hypothetical protein [Aquimarina sp. I32.4]|uniref:hypothetical protein n=1 Tax=Aquimarina sp. I32.4 TaxID=2053903 RepID=UPI000CDEA671|nr:hypothetical protein [Aquimarina sp. I32.4]
MEITGIDPLTQETFTKKRSNQKFATRENQIEFNNLKARRKRQAKAHLDRILDKNRSIMGFLLGDQKEVTRSHDFLLGAGFNFGCNTHTILDHQGIKWSCIYEYAYCRTEDEKFKIIKTPTE